MNLFFFLPRDCFLSTYIATEYAFTSSIHYDPPRMAMVAAAAAVVLHTHTHTIFVCFAASLTVQYSAFVFSAAAAAAAAPALYFGKTVASHIGDASPIACKLPVLP